jgi:hypothetical protein
MKLLFLSAILFVSSFAWSLEPYQGLDQELENWMCGAPMVVALRKSDPDNLLQDPSGNFRFKESLETISESNLQRLKKKLGALGHKEKSLVDLIVSKYNPPIVHRTSVETSKIVIKSRNGLVSATKRRESPAVTPMIEQRMFAGHDCIFTSVASPYGIREYGTVLLRFEDKKGFAWGSMYTGYRWALEVEGVSDLSRHPGDGMIRRFARQIYTNNHWDEALGLLIIENVRAGSTFRGKGASYDKTQILDQLLAEPTQSSFWSRVVRHRLAFLEGHYVDNIPLDDVKFMQYRNLDKPTVETWGLPSSWFGGHDSFIQFFNRAH